MADDAGQVKVDYYGYSKCPDYVSLEAQLVKIPGDIDDLYNLHLYFFAKVDSSYPTGFYCMHGQSECYGDFASACAVKLSNNNRTQWLLFTQCENANYSNVPDNQDSCAKVAGLDLNEFHDCIANDGYGLLLDGTNRAAALGLTWSPTIFFNDVQECEWDTTPCNTPRGASDFTKLICSEYTGSDPPPASCT